MRLSIQAEPVYNFAEGTQVIASIVAAHSTDQSSFPKPSTFSPPSS